jgi:hypothetical protein
MSFDLIKSIKVLWQLTKSVYNIGHGEAQHRKYKRLGGGQAYSGSIV